MKASFLAVLGALGSVGLAQEIIDSSITFLSTISLDSLSTATSSPSGSSLSPSTSSSSPPSASSSTPSGGVCGYGYTYCGWMLVTHNGFSDYEVKKAFCDGKGGCDEIDHQGNTTYLSGLFVCRPAGPVKSSPRPTSELDQAPALRFRPGKRAVLVARDATTESSPAPSACSDSGSGSGPHKLTLLCACSGSSFIEERCLNPPDDNIGRCATPCKN